MTRYPIETLPLPIKPGDNVYCIYVSDDGLDVGFARTNAVGVSHTGHIVARTDTDLYEVGIDDLCFLTLEDMRRYVKDPTCFDESYGTFDHTLTDAPWHPGDDIYSCDKEELLESCSECVHVLFTERGEVLVRDMFDEFCVIGERIDPCFHTDDEATDYLCE